MSNFLLLNFSFLKKRGLFQKNARAERSAELDNEVMQMELQKKVAENETLHKKVSLLVQPVITPAI